MEGGLPMVSGALSFSFNHTMESDETFIKAKELRYNGWPYHL